MGKRVSGSGSGNGRHAQQALAGRCVISRQLHLGADRLGMMRGGEWLPQKCPSVDKVRRTGSWLGGPKPGNTLDGRAVFLGALDRCSVCRLVWIWRGRKRRADRVDTSRLAPRFMVRCAVYIRVLAINVSQIGAVIHRLLGPRRISCTASAASFATDQKHPDVKKATLLVALGRKHRPAVMCPAQSVIHALVLSAVSARMDSAEVYQHTYILSVHWLPLVL